jgi:hypothetical protein
MIETLKQIAIHCRNLGGDIEISHRRFNDEYCWYLRTIPRLIDGSWGKDLDELLDGVLTKLREKDNGSK